MLFYIILFLLIIIICYTTKYARSEYKILTNKDKLKLENLLPAGVYFTRNFNIQGIGALPEFLIYEKNKIKYFSYILKPRATEELYKMFNEYKKLYNASEYFFHIYTRINLDFIDADKLMKGAHFSPIYHYDTKFLGYRLTTNKDYLSELELRPSNISKYSLHFFQIPDPKEYAKKWYELFELYKINTILCYSKNIYTISACIGREKVYILDNSVAYKNVRNIVGTLYKEYDAIIYKEQEMPMMPPPAPCKYIITGNMQIKKIDYIAPTKNIICKFEDIKNYPNMIIDKITSSSSSGIKVYMRPHKLLTPSNFEYPWLNNIKCWDVLVEAWKKYQIAEIIEGDLSMVKDTYKNIGKCLGTINIPIIRDHTSLSINYFNEYSKLICRRKNQDYSFLDFFNKVILPRKEYILEWFQSGKLPEYITCSDYNPDWSYTLLTHFKARRVLDMSAGRGARLMGALLAGCDYYLGIDPNKESNNANRSLGYFYKTWFNLHTNFELIDSPYEKPWESGRKDEPFDILITSPPYFDLEIYIPLTELKLGKEQSIYNRPFKKWLDEFLIFSICKTAKFIKNGGHVLINIDVTINKTLLVDYITPMLDSKKIKEAGLQYIGYYSVNSLRVPCAFWTFKKVGEV